MEKILDILGINEPDYKPLIGMTPYEMTIKVFHSLEGIELFLGLSEVYGHMQVLEKRGLISTVKQDSIRFYMLKA